MLSREWLTEIRVQTGFNQSQVARNVGISPCYYNQIENGSKVPSGIVAFKIASFLKFDMSKFFYQKCC